MKLNWGSGIAIFYTCFVIAMILMLVKSCHNKSDLVEEAYYEKDLGYEEFRLKRTNGNAIVDEIEVWYDPSSYNLNLFFPRSMEGLKGEIMLYRSSNKYLDKKYEIKVDSMNLMKINLGRKFPKGLWKIKLDWECKGVDYYNELDFTI